MEQTQLVVEVTEQVMEKLNETRQLVEKQTEIFERRLIHRILEKLKNVNEERLKEIFINSFTSKITEEMNAFFNYCQLSEIERYNKDMKTADLMFNTLKDKRTQVIYLEKLIKQLNQREIEIENIFTESSKDRFSSELVETTTTNIDAEEKLSLDEIFRQYSLIIINNPHLSVDEAHDLQEDLNNDYNLYKHDVALVVNRMLEDNKTFAITRIEEEMDNKDLRNGKTSAIYKQERNITDNALEKIEELLVETITKHKKNAEKDLKNCSIDMADLICNSLPEGYQDQKGLIEIIVDTNIDRLGYLLNEETQKLKDNLHSKNENMIKNELYEEKRYKDIKNYECDFELVDKVYQDVLEEISRAYDYNLLGMTQQFELLKSIVLKESLSTKVVFRTLINNINLDNLRNLNTVITEMHHLSEKARINVGDNTEINVAKKG